MRKGEEDEEQAAAGSGASPSPGSASDLLDAVVVLALLTAALRVWLLLLRLLLLPRPAAAAEAEETMVALTGDCWAVTTMAQVGLRAGMGARAGSGGREPEEKEAAGVAAERRLLLRCFAAALAGGLPRLPASPLLRSARMRTSSSPSYSTSLSSPLLAEGEAPVLRLEDDWEPAEREREEDREREGDEQPQSALAQHEPSEPLEYQLPLDDDDGDCGDGDEPELSEAAGEAERRLLGRWPVDTAGLSLVLRGRDDAALREGGVRGDAA